MCGILGTMPPTNKNQFKVILNLLHHRGPDEYGIETVGNDITLGHKRLSIVDIDNGQQPMFDTTKRYSLVFNGEIYNFLEIKKELENKGYMFRSSSDTEVLLNSYIHWGEKAVLKFNGMWAFAIWDSLKQELFLSKDRFGKKPLFYAFIEGKFIFASEMKAIFPFLKKVRPSKDFHWMKKNIFLYENTEKCLVDGIKRFPLGHNATYKNGKLKIKRYWNTLDHLIETPQTYKMQVESFRELFLDACKIRMRSDVPIGTALSGGLDSSSTIAAMAYLSKNKVDYGKNDWQHAFVASFPGTPIDESKYAKIIADHVGLNATFINIDPLKYWNKIDQLFYMFEELYITNPVPMIATYEAVKKNGTTVTLDGHGADELFSGYGHILDAIWDSKYSIKDTMDVIDTYRATLLKDDQFKKNDSILFVIKYILKKLGNNFFQKNDNSKDSNHLNFKKLDNFSKHLYVIFHETILPTLLRNYDRYSMINGVEIRMPFMDHRVVSFVNSIPYKSKFGDGYTKKLIRDAMDPFMPKEITWRKSKIGFNSPIVDWMQGDLKDWFSDTVHNKSFLETDLIENSRKIQKTVMDIVNKKENNYTVAQKSWTSLSPYLWGEAILKRKYNIE